jgi:hypothetical protein
MPEGDAAAQVSRTEPQSAIVSAGDSHLVPSRPSLVWGSQPGHGRDTLAAYSVSERRSSGPLHRLLTIFNLPELPRMLCLWLARFT